MSELELILMIGLLILSPVTLLALILGEKVIKQYKYNKRYKIRKNCFWKVEVESRMYCTFKNKFSSPEQCYRCEYFRK